MSDLLRYIFSTQESFQDARRVESLYDNLKRFQQIEPLTYRENITAWRLALLSAARKGLIPPPPGKNERSRFVMSTGDQLVQALQSRQFGLPQSLDVVLADAAHRRDIIPLSEFEKATTSIHNKSWLPQLPTLGDIVWWSWRQVVGEKPHNPLSLPKAEWVVPASIEEASQEFLTRLSDATDSQTSAVHSLSTLKATLGNKMPLSDSDLNILLKYLSRDKPSLTYDTSLSHYAEPIIKIGTPPSPITNEDVAIVTLKSTMLGLESKVSPLEHHVVTLEKAARAYVAEKRLASAKSALKRKNLASSTLERLRDQAHRIQEMLDSIDRAKDQVTMVKAMEASTKVLKDLHEEMGGAEHVADVVDALGEQMANVDEVSNIINEPAGAAIDETEVEDEFEQMLTEERAREKKKQEEAEAAELANRLAQVGKTPQGMDSNTQVEEDIEKQREGVEKLELAS